MIALPMGEEPVVTVQTARGPVDVDASLAPIVAALNAAGVETVASCSGHGHRPGNIALRDGREIIIARNFEEARRVDALFPVGANGEEVSQSPEVGPERCERCGAGPLGNCGVYGAETPREACPERRRATGQPPEVGKTLLSLAARCEKAEEPGLDLDHAIHDAVGDNDGAPLYTRSLDAAMSLVPEGMNWMAGNRNQPKARAYVENGELRFLGGMARNPALRWFEVVAATPALALAAAALRARATPSKARGKS